MTVILKRWPLVALAVSAGMLATAHIFERMGYAPCTLCLRQREVYWVALAVAAAAFAVSRTPVGARLAKAFDLALALIFLVGAGVAFYHAGVEWKWWPGPAACASTGAAVTAADMAALLNGEPVRPPACDEPNWFFLGLTMADWNTLVSLALAATGFAAFLKRGKA